MEFNGKIIYINTIGDSPTAAERDFKGALQTSGLESTDIDIYISAAHETKKFKQILNKIAEEIKNAKIEIINKQRSSTPSEQDILNEQDAEKILNEILK